MPSEPLTQTPEWSRLAAHHAQIAHTPLRDLFAADPQRFERFSVQTQGLLFDYSKHIATREAIDLLLALAKAADLSARRADLFAGKAVNTTEGRAALHMALRGGVADNVTADGESVTAFAVQSRDKIRAESERLRGGAITDVVHIGIGGSDLGPQMACAALRAFADGPRVHFVSNIDPAHMAAALAGLNPENTAFIVASKTFTTLETMQNAKAARDWSGGTQAFTAITANPAAAQDFGIAADRILPLRAWIGGRFSLWSAIGLPVAVACGHAHFEAMLEGAREADHHFLNAPDAENIPVLMALLGLWYRNFFDARAQAVIPYAQDLHRLPAYLQQLEMESNGKHVTTGGAPVTTKTAPVIFGEPGTGAQHAFFQFLHQGSDVVPCDFIAAINPHGDAGRTAQDRLLANMLAQARALMEGDPQAAEPHRRFAGGRPSSVILMDRLDPRSLGFMVALYEHKTFTQGILWNVNSFDQWGVELGKTMAKDIAEALENNKETKSADSSTTGLARHILQNKR